MFPSPTIEAEAKGKRVYIGLPDQRLQEISNRSRSLERFLMDSFNLLISSTSVMEAEAAVQQGIRSQRLTNLAFLYIPLSFVTGVFGMNVREINGSPLSIWVPVVAVGITLGLTAVLFTIYGGWGKRHVETSIIVPAFRPESGK
ncbi:hypothetical protein K431DRAFT_29739 [Polychaeton citri CBS 116435]|uniref:Mg2+ transporter protein n=1 Tax=Polychaeton citri CBS 116435 TaxID=1314669 RepID=A0A9P4PW75_9PEZI|nr:hypothetical protein K431DRAFT_29739 [Polychaeton citri CBS 116435]